MILPTALPRWYRPLAPPPSHICLRKSGSFISLMSGRTETTRRQELTSNQNERHSNTLRILDPDDLLVQLLDLQKRVVVRQAVNEHEALSVAAVELGQGRVLLLAGRVEDLEKARLAVYFLNGGTRKTGNTRSERVLNIQLRGSRKTDQDVCAIWRYGGRWPVRSKGNNQRSAQTLSRLASQPSLRVSHSSNAAESQSTYSCPRLSGRTSR